MGALAYLLFFALLLPLAVLNVLGIQTLATLPVAGVRVLIHVTFFATLAVTAISTTLLRVRRRGLQLRLTPLSLLILSSLLVGLSILLNDIDASSLFRGLTVILHAVNLVILFPAVCSGFDVTPFIRALGRLFILFSLALAGMATTYQITGASSSPRLGYPLNPGVFAYYMLLALLTSAGVFRNQVLSWLFLIAIALSGSRSSLALGIGALILLLYWKRKLVLTFIALAVMIVLLRGDYEAYLGVLARNPEDMTSGRTRIWTLALERIAARPLIGYGSPQAFSVAELGLDAGNETELVAHNSFLDLCLTYGFFYALTTTALWFAVFLPSRRNLSTAYRHFVLALWLAVSFRSLVSNTFWTNMGDAATMFALLILLANNSSARRIRLAPASRNASHPHGLESVCL